MVRMFCENYGNLKTVILSSLEGCETRMHYRLKKSPDQLYVFINRFGSINDEEYKIHTHIDYSVHYNPKIKLISSNFYQ